jgi:hypothetical protein
MNESLLFSKDNVLKTTEIIFLRPVDKEAEWED